MAKKTSKGHKWKGPLPKGWTDESRTKFWNSLTGRSPKHKVKKCIEKIQGTSITDPGAFCAALADRVIPGWREEAAKERRKKKALTLVAKVAKDLKEELPDPDEVGHSLLPGSDTMALGDQKSKIASSEWITQEEMENLCSPCANRMRKAGFKRVHVSVARRLLQS